MQSLVISVVFGEPLRHGVGWITEREAEHVPPVGAPITLVTGEDEELIVCHVVRAWDADEDSPGGIFIYAGPDLPSAEFSASMEEDDWEPLAPETVTELLDVIAHSPAVANVHHLILCIGDPDTIATDPGRMWAWSVEPEDPTLPLFGQRARVFPTSEAPDEDADEAASEVDANYDMMGRASADNGVTAGLATVTVFAAIAEPGEADIVLWTPTLGDIDLLDLVASGWSPVTEEYGFDPVEFRLADRIRLAMATRLTLTEGPHGDPEIVDWDVQDAVSVDPNDYELLPPLLAGNCSAARDLVNIDDIVAGWISELRDGDSKAND